MNDYISGDTLSKTQNTDALAWSIAFEREVLEKGTPAEGVVHGWFANAIQAAEDHVRNNPQRFDLQPVRRDMGFPSDRGPINVKGKDPKAVVEAINDARTISASKQNLLAILDYAHYGLSGSSPEKAAELESLIDALRAEVDR